MGEQLTGIHLVAGRHVPIPRARRASLAVKLLARIRGASLDETLTHGADPASSPLLAQRAAWLTSSRNRRKLARSLNEILAPPNGRVGPSAAVRPHRGALEDARLSLTGIAALLDQTAEPVYSRGVAMVQLLLTQVDSPLYAPTRLAQLRLQADAIVRALEGAEETWS